MGSSYIQNQQHLKLIHMNCFTYEHRANIQHSSVPTFCFCGNRSRINLNPNPDHVIATPTSDTYTMAGLF